MPGIKQSYGNVGPWSNNVNVGGRKGAVHRHCASLVPSHWNGLAPWRFSGGGTTLMRSRLPFGSCLRKYFG